MKKTIIIIMSFIIIGQSFGIYKLLNKSEPIITKNIVTTSSPKIIYKDKIVYKNNAITEKILFQTDLFLFINRAYPDGYFGDGCNDQGLNVNNSFKKGNRVLTDQELLEGITHINKNYPKGMLPNNNAF
jgi:hypothetical protein